VQSPEAHEVLTRMLITVVAALTALLTLLAINARGAAAPGGRPVQIALVETLSSPSARAELVRFADPARADLILLKAHQATAEDLAAALAMLRDDVGRRPTRPGTVARTTITGIGALSTSLKPLRSHADGMLRTVQRAPVVRIGTLGHGRWREFDRVP
jgi:hypothetical protein